MSASDPAIVGWEEVTWGEVVFVPVPYNSFRVGPFTSHVPVHEGEDREAIRAKALESLKRTAQAEFRAKHAWFVNALGEVRG